MKHYDPLFGNNKRKQSITAADLSRPINVEAAVPLSPISNTPMQLVEGANEGKTFKMWVNLKDRLALPAQQ